MSCGFDGGLRLVAFVVLLLPVYARAYDVAGTVIDGGGEAVAGADVWISQDRSVRASRTDDRGRFLFRDVAVGPIEIVARKEGYALGGQQGQVIDDAKVVLRLYEAGSTRLRVINPASEPVEGARVKTLFIASSFHVPVADLVGHGFPSIRSGADGFMTIPNLPKGSHASFKIAHRRYAEREVPTLPVGSELDIILEHGLRVRGRVMNPAGEAVARARVSLFRGDKEFTEVMTGPDGFYSAIVPVGQYFLAVRHLDYAIPEPIAVEWPPGEAAAEVNVTLPPPHVIRGSVVGPEDAPAPGTRIAYIAREVLFAEAMSDVEGRFEVTVSAGKGILRVIPPPRMYTVGNPDIYFELEEEKAIEIGPIELARLPDIEGTVTARGDVALDKVLVTTVGMKHPKRTVTDEDGEFKIRLETMPRDDEVRFRAEHAFRFLRQDFEVDIRRLRRKEVRLQRFKPDLSTAPENTPNHMHHMVGKAAPAIVCDDWFNVPEEGSAPSIEGLRGKVIVLTLWGGWDVIGVGPDRTDELNRLYALYEDEDDVAFVSVHDASSSAEEVGQYVRQYGIRFPVGRDADPTLTFDAYNVNTIPQTVLIDRQGMLRFFHVDGRLLELIKALRRE